MARRKQEITDLDFYQLKAGKVWQHFKGESFAFWMICAYLFFEYVRPQSIVKAIDILPWTQLAIVGAFLGCLSDKTVKWVSSPVNVLLLLYLVIILLSSINAYFPGVSYENLRNYYLWVIIYFLIINIVNTRRRFFIFLCIFLLASFKISLSLAITWAQRGFSFTSWGLSGPPGFFQNSGELAIQMLVFWPIALAFATALKPYVSQWWYRALLMMPVTAIMVILGSSSRGGQLALVVQLIVMSYRSIFRPKVLMTIGVSLFLIWQLLPEEQKERFEGMGEDRTSQQRILYFENGVDMIKDHPFLGVGFFNFRQYFDLYYPEDALFGRAELPHNIFIQVGTDAGLIGLFIFSLLVFYSLRIPRSVDTCNDDERRVGLAKYGNISVFGFLVAGQFVTVAYYPYFWIHLSLLVAMKNSFSK
ncbi:MAG: O-antigen ligase family protein [Candidatus Aminicenantes bacterium]|nr:O-antigen ligase family protein [Candidatus Aminicenantes bacterium]